MDYSVFHWFFVHVFDTSSHVLDGSCPRCRIFHCLRCLMLMRRYEQKGCRKANKREKRLQEKLSCVSSANIFAFILLACAPRRLCNAFLQAAVPRHKKKNAQSKELSDIALTERTKISFAKEAGKIKWRYSKELKMQRK